MQRYNTNSAATKLENDPGQVSGIQQGPEMERLAQHVCHTMTPPQLPAPDKA